MRPLPYRDARFDDEAIELEELSDDRLTLRKQKVSKRFQSQTETLQNTSQPYLENLQLLETILNQLLDLARVLLSLVLAKRISRSALGVLAEIVSSDLLALPY